MNEIYVFLADGFEEVEAFTPVDYLRRCKNLSDYKNVVTVGISDLNVMSSHGIKISADKKLDEIKIENAKMLILPGGMPGTKNLAASSVLLSFLKYAVCHEIYIAAICAAPSILGEQGYLKGKKATCANGFEDMLNGAIYTGTPVEVADYIITARGAGVANQFAFTLIEKLYGKEQAEKIKDAVRWEK